VTFFILIVCLIAAVFLAWKEKKAKKIALEAMEEKEKERKDKGKTVNQTGWHHSHSHGKSLSSLSNMN
jgi:hypothetical protein